MRPALFARRAAWLDAAHRAALEAEAAREASPSVPPSAPDEPICWRCHKSVPGDWDAHIEGCQG